MIRRVRVVAVLLIGVAVVACGGQDEAPTSLACSHDVIAEDPDSVVRDLGHRGDWRVVPPVTDSGGAGALLVSPPLVTVVTCGDYATMQAAGSLRLDVGGELRWSQHVTQVTSSLQNYSLKTWVFLEDEEVDEIELVDSVDGRIHGAWAVGEGAPAVAMCGDAAIGGSCNGWRIIDVVLDDPRVPRPLTGVAMLALTSSDRPGQPAYHGVTSSARRELRIAVAPGPATRLMIDLFNGTDETVELDPPIEIPLDPTG